MAKRFRDWSPNQIWLFPPSPKDWLLKGHLVYFVLDAVAELDLQPILAHYEKSPQGQPPKAPRDRTPLKLGKTRPILRWATTYG